jgi:hypothetical protein
MTGTCRAVVIAVMLVGLTPALAQAQAEADERPTLRLGPFEIRPRLLFTNIGVDNNVFNEAENPKQDFTFVAQPDAELSVRPGRARLAWVTGAEFVYYHRYRTERSVNRSQVLSGELDLDWLRPFARYGTSHTSARPNTEIDIRARRHLMTYAAGTGVQLATRTSALFTLRGSRETYDENVLYRGQELAETLNQKGREYEGAVALQLTPLTSLSLIVARQENRFTEAPERDANSLRIAPSLTFSTLGLLNGTAWFGYRRFEGLDASMPEYNGFTTGGTLAVVLAGRYRVETRFTRDVQYSYEKALPYYVLTGGRGTVATQVSDRFDVRVTGGRDHMAYRAFAGGTPPGSDRLDVYGGGIGCLLGDRRRLVVQAEFTRRHSPRDASRAFRNNRIFATLTWGA